MGVGSRVHTDVLENNNSNFGEILRRSSKELKLNLITVDLFDFVLKSFGVWPGVTGLIDMAEAVRNKDEVGAR